MRFPMLTLTLAIGLAAAGSACAQMMGPTMMTPMPPANATYGGGIDTPAYPSRQELYASKIAALKAKMQRLTASDGGQLTPEHRAGLQQELDALNRRFGLKPAHG